MVKVIFKIADVDFYNFIKNQSVLNLRKIVYNNQRLLNTIENLLKIVDS